AALRERIRTSLGTEDVVVTAVADGSAALDVLKDQKVDCVVFNAQAPRLIDRLASASEEGQLLEVPANNGEAILSRLPVIVYGAGEAARDEVAWKKLEKGCTVRRAQSQERLLDLAAFCLHRDVSKLPEPARQQLIELHQSDKSLAGKKVLIVDDDMRNIF